MEFNIQCPITTQIMAEPVLAHDGIAYERQAIIKWFKDHNKSPYTQKVISKDIIPIVHLKSYIEDHLKEHPELRDDVYVPEKSHSECKDQISSIINNKKWTELKNYQCFDMSLFTENDLNTLLKECKDVEIWKYVVDNIINLEYSHPKTKKRLIHYVSNKLSLILKYVVDKNVDLNCKDKYKWMPIHYTCRHHNQSCINYMIEKGAKIDCVTDLKKTPLQLLLDYRAKYTIISTIKSFNKLKRSDITRLVNNKRVSNSDLIEIMKYIDENDLIDKDEKVD